MLVFLLQAEEKGMTTSQVAKVLGCAKNNVTAMCKRRGISLKSERNYCRAFYEQVVIPYDGDDCLIWPYARTKKGYGLAQWGGEKTYVHRLICEEVHGAPPSDAHQAAHSCGRGHDGCVSRKHLRWATPQENKDDMLLHGTVIRGEEASWSTLTEAKVLYIRAMRGVKRQKDLAIEFGVSRSAIALAMSGKTWRHVQE